MNRAHHPSPIDTLFALQRHRANKMLYEAYTKVGNQTAAETIRKEIVEERLHGF
jgi:hypothetical protein